MAATVDNSSKASSVTPATTLEDTSWVLGGSNRVLYVLAGAAAAGGSSAPTAVRWGGSGGTALTQIGTTLTVNTCAVTLWMLIAPTAQTSTVHITWPATYDERWLIAVSTQDADQITPNGTVAQATGTSTTPSVSATSVSGNLVLDFMSWVDSSASNITATDDVPDSLQEIEGATLGFEGAGASRETASGTSTTASWTLSASAPWGIFALAVNGLSGPTIDTQPQWSAAAVNATTQYTVAATTSGGTLTYLWQYSADAGQTWATATGGSGVDTATYTTAQTTSNMNGWQYRCNVTDNNGTRTTLGVYFFVKNLPNTGRGRRLPTSGWFARTENKGGLRGGANPNLLRKNSTRTAGEGGDADIASAWRDWFIAPAPTLPEPLRLPIQIVATQRPRPGRGPYSLGEYFRPDRRFFGDPAVSSITTVNATQGTWTWVGSIQSFPVPQISATPGTWTWAGSAASINVQQINQITGAWTWVGSAASLAVQQINQTTGTWTWAGSAATIDVQQINQVTGTWTWAGSTQGITTPGGATEINATIGSWSWAGSQASLEPQAVNATVGAWSWVGSAASVAVQSVDATPGLWAWAGSVQGIIQQITIDANPGLWTWAGSQASIQGEGTPLGHGFEMVGTTKRRNLVYLEPDKPIVPRKTITKRDVDKRIFEEAHAKASEIIKTAAVEHAAGKVSKQVRYASIRSALKPLQKSLGDWNWINLYQRMYDNALNEAIANELQVIENIDEENLIIAILIDQL